ncbi:hypothetical protein C0Q70_09665 [Pomacea canaliculata]|uniref:Uncharacterized protein n=1 Tax=Pomacea canaliculata TaxID=400727 RepID=A0A2T7PAF8_POMCA|nr:hypothetical protein C0Q70_09665 [Pomacea canaliculata]
MSATNEEVVDAIVIHLPRVLVSLAFGFTLLRPVVLSLEVVVNAGPQRKLGAAGKTCQQVQAEVRPLLTIAKVGVGVLADSRVGAVHSGKTVCNQAERCRAAQRWQQSDAACRSLDDLPWSRDQDE